MISEDTRGSSVTVKIFAQRGAVEAPRKISLISSTVVFFFEIKVISAIEPIATGTRIDMPSNFPSSDGYAYVTAIAAPVEEGTMFWPAERPSRKSFLFGLSISD